MPTGEESERWLRDLHWAVTSPFLMSGPPSCSFAINLDEIEPPPEIFSGHRVGYYFESLIEFWLEEVREVEMLAKGHQIIDNGRTLGELDFVFRDENGAVNHWEVAAKFYLYCPDQTFAGSHFIGPNAGDTFERKRDKIFDQQLPLSASNFPQVTLRSAFVKGRIFYNPNHSSPDRLPDELSEDHLRGIWLHQSEIAWLESSLEAKYCIAHKPYWLAAGAENERSFANLRIFLDQHFSTKSHPILLTAIAPDLEPKLIFIVPDHWPNIG